MPFFEFQIGLIKYFNFILIYLHNKKNKELLFNE